jgi:hypothetical protein
LEKHPVREHARQLTSLAQKQKARLEKLCNAIGLPPMLCVFVVLGVCIGLLGIVRTMNYTGLMSDGPALATR